MQWRKSGWLGIVLVAALLASGLRLGTVHAADDPAADQPLRVCLVSGSGEYRSDLSLPPFQKHLEQHYPVKVTLLQASGFESLPGTSALAECDVALFFTRRLTVEGEALEHVQKYCQSGKPIVAVRTASHGFQKWLVFDKEFLGGNYQGHFGDGPVCQVRTTAAGEEHPLLHGVPRTMASKYSLYKTAPLAEDCRLLMEGETTESNGPQPVTWVRQRGQQRIVYTALGGVEDFEQAGFRRLLVNSLFWAAGRDVPEK